MLACLGEEFTHPKALTFGDRQRDLGLSGEIFPSLPFRSSDKMMEEAVKNKRKHRKPWWNFSLSPGSAGMFWALFHSTLELRTAT